MFRVHLHQTKLQIIFSLMIVLALVGCKEQVGESEVLELETAQGTLRTSTGVTLSSSLGGGKAFATTETTGDQGNFYKIDESGGVSPALSASLSAPEQAAQPQALPADGEVDVPQRDFMAELAADDEPTVKFFQSSQYGVYAEISNSTSEQYKFFIDYSDNITAIETTGTFVGMNTAGDVLFSNGDIYRYGTNRLEKLRTTLVDPEFAYMSGNFVQVKSGATCQILDSITSWRSNYDCSDITGLSSSTAIYSKFLTLENGNASYTNPPGEWTFHERRIVPDGAVFLSYWCGTSSKCLKHVNKNGETSIIAPAARFETNYSATDQRVLREQDNPSLFVTGDKVIVKELTAISYISRSEGIRRRILQGKSITQVTVGNDKIYYIAEDNYGRGSTGIYNLNTGQTEALPAEFDFNRIKANPMWDQSYTVTFDANGGTGSMEPQSIGYGNSAALTNNAFSREGYIFAGWAKGPNKAVGYQNQASLVMGNQNLTLYAYWARDWQQTAYLKAINGGAGDKFGRSVGVSASGAILVGAPQEDSADTSVTNVAFTTNNLPDDNNKSNSGAAYWFGYWPTAAKPKVLSRYYKAVNAGGGDEFGGLVAIDSTTATAVMYAVREGSDQTTISNLSAGDTVPTDNSSYDSGALYVYKGSNLQAYIKLPIKFGSSSWSIPNGYGTGSIVLQGDTLALGFMGDDSQQTTITNGSSSPTDTGAENSGAVYVFKRTGETWAQEAYLKAPNAQKSDNFGSAISLDQDTLVSCSPGEKNTVGGVVNGAITNVNYGNSLLGACYVFTRTGATWSYQAYIKSPQPTKAYQFGMSMAFKGDTLFIASSSDCLLANKGFVSQGSLLLSQPNYLMEIEGCPTVGVESNRGTVFIYKRAAGNWSLFGILKPRVLSKDLNGYFLKLAYDGEYLAVASTKPSKLSFYLVDSVALQLYEANSEGAFSLVKDLAASNPDETNGFGGWGLSMYDGVLAVGAPYDDSGEFTIRNNSTASTDTSATDSGAVFVFEPVTE